MSSDGENKLTRLMVIGKVFDNNCKLFDLVHKQINLLETYQFVVEWHQYNLLYNHHQIV